MDIKITQCNVVFSELVSLAAVHKLQLYNHHTITGAPNHLYHHHTIRGAPQFCNILPDTRTLKLEDVAINN
jgi:hypothetical protein